jgi:sulfite exporter TauE/SafE
MSYTLALTALVMGLVGGPHCIAMCGAACGGIARAGGGHRGLLLFQLGRLGGYAALGGAAAASMQAVGWLSTQSVALRPVWTMLHLAALLLGLTLLWQARQPIWLEDSGRRIFTRARAAGARWGSAAPLLLGGLWALMPCGLLYSALLVAALAGGPLHGAAVMALFALGSSVSLLLGPWLWLRLRHHAGGADRWAVRLAGLALAATAGWALWMGLVHDQAPWCLPISS